MAGKEVNMTSLQKIWLHLFSGGELSDRGAMVKFGYGAFRSRVAEMREIYHIKDRWDRLDINGSRVDYKIYSICPEWLKTSEAQKIKMSLTQNSAA